MKRHLWRKHVPPALQWAPITRDASGNVGSFWGWNFSFSFSRANPRWYWTLDLRWYLSHMRSLSFAHISLPFIIISEGKFEFIWHSFIHFVFHHWHTVVFWRTPGNERNLICSYKKRYMSCSQEEKSEDRSWINPWKYEIFHLRNIYLTNFRLAQERGLVMVRVCLLVLVSDPQQTTMESALLALPWFSSTNNPVVITTEH